MKHRLFLAIFFSIVSIVFAQEPTTVWFDSVKKPTLLSSKQLLDITTRLYGVLRSGQSEDAFLSELPKDATPRIIFLTIGDDLWPARTYFGTGHSFADAMKSAIQILRSNETAKKAEIIKQADSVIKDAARDKLPFPASWAERKKNPNAWHWLKLQVVQATRPYMSFTFHASRFSFTDLVGFSFGPSLGFCFTPDQLTGRYLTTESGAIAKQQIGNIISETYNFEALSTWLRACSFQKAQRICLFEVDTYFTDGKQASQLYRCHSLPYLPNAEQCQNAAVKAAQKMLPYINKKNGRLQVDTDEWDARLGKKESLNDVAEFVLALQAIARVTKDTQYSVAALYAAQPLLKAMMQFGPGKGITALVSDEILPPNSMRQPRKICSIRENALALIALTDLVPLPALKEENKIARPTINHCKSLAAAILSLKDSNGNYLVGKILPDLIDIPYSDTKWQDESLDQALVALALHRASKACTVPEWETESQAIIAKLIAVLLKYPAPTLKLDPWCVEALSEIPPKSKEHTRLMQALGVAIMRDHGTVSAADFPGVPASSPNYTAAARTAWAASRLAAWFKEAIPPFEEALMADNALRTSFHIQAAIDLPLASILSCPQKAMGFFRNTPDAMDLTLHAQNSQIFALLKTAQVLNACHRGVFPDAESAQAEITQARRLMSIHPGYINANVITESNTFQSFEDLNTTGEISGKKVTQGKVKDFDFLNKQPGDSSGSKGTKGTAPVKRK